MIVLAIYFGLLSLQRAANACWQVFWCRVIFNWRAGSLFPLSKNAWEEEEKGLLSHRLMFDFQSQHVDSSRPEQLEATLLVIVFIITSPIGGGFPQAPRTWLNLLVLFFTCTKWWQDNDWGAHEYISYSRQPERQAKFNWRAAEDLKQDRHEKTRRLLVSVQLLSKPSGDWRCVNAFVWGLWYKENVSGGCVCVCLCRGSSGSVFRSAVVTRLITYPSTFR